VNKPHEILGLGVGTCGRRGATRSTGATAADQLKGRRYSAPASQHHQRAAGRASTRATLYDGGIAAYFYTSAFGVTGSRVLQRRRRFRSNSHGEEVGEETAAAC
jgi:hypothetical protein